MTNIKDNETLNRMKSLMNYGLQTESKNNPYSAIEYQKMGADGNVYAIIREGKKYYIKTASNKKNLLKEDFKYIGGFRITRACQYTDNQRLLYFPFYGTVKGRCQKKNGNDT